MSKVISTVSDDAQRLLNDIKEFPFTSEENNDLDYSYRETLNLPEGYQLYLNLPQEYAEIIDQTYSVTTLDQFVKEHQLNPVLLTKIQEAYKERVIETCDDYLIIRDQFNDQIYLDNFRQLKKNTVPFYAEKFMGCFHDMEGPYSKSAYRDYNQKIKKNYIELSDINIDEKVFLSRVSELLSYETDISNHIEWLKTYEESDLFKQLYNNSEYSIRFHLDCIRALHELTSIEDKDKLLPQSFLEKLVQNVKPVIDERYGSQDFVFFKEQLIQLYPTPLFFLLDQWKGEFNLEKLAASTAFFDFDGEGSWEAVCDLYPDASMREWLTLFPKVFFNTLPLFKEGTSPWLDGLVHLAKKPDALKIFCRDIPQHEVILETISKYFEIGASDNPQDFMRQDSHFKREYLLHVVNFANQVYDSDKFVYKMNVYKAAKFEKVIQEIINHQIVRLSKAKKLPPQRKAAKFS